MSYKSHKLEGQMVSIKNVIGVYSDVKQEENTCLSQHKPIPVAPRTKVWVCCRSLAGMACSNLAGGRDVCLLLLSRRGLCDEMITRPEESYRVWCLSVIVKPWKMTSPWPTTGCRAIKKKQSTVIRSFITTLVNGLEIGRWTVIM